MNEDIFSIVALVSVIALALTLRRNGTTPLWRAKNIMGREYFMPRDAVVFTKAHFPAGSRARMRLVPWNAKTLKSLAGTHALCAVPPMSVRLMYERFNYRFGIVPLTHLNLWNEVGMFDYHLVRRMVLPGSGGISFESQRRLFSGQDVLPPARVLIYAMLAFLEKQGEFLFEPGELIRCMDTDEQGNFIAVGYAGKAPHRIDIQLLPRDHVSPNLYVAPERPPDWPR